MAHFVALWSSGLDMFHRELISKRSNVRSWVVRPGRVRKDSDLLRLSVGGGHRGNTAHCWVDAAGAGADAAGEAAWVGATAGAKAAGAEATGLSSFFSSARSSRSFFSRSASSRARRLASKVSSGNLPPACLMGNLPSQRSMARYWSTVPVVDSLMI